MNSEPTAQQALVAAAASSLLDPQGRALAAQVQWWPLPELGGEGPWPVAVLGEGPPVLLLHGFDSSFLEFRRLAPLLASGVQLFIPDLYGFGFCPRPSGGDYSPSGVLRHLEVLAREIGSRNPAPLGLIGASMGGSVAVELARRLPEQVNRLLLLAPAGLTGRPMPLPPLLDGLGVRFLALPGVRRGLCRTAFADPDAAVGAAELEIASLHLQSPGWADALRRFARSGGFAGAGAPLPHQPIKVLWGANDRILRAPQKRAALALLGERVLELDACGHLPHLDQTATVAATWLDAPSQQ
ncbi:MULTISPECIES: alpha/beta fold hydrolase [unclassified Cyanobium]|uniref:alpha/beta fold hydrolase n=1 Tax=unclassified Cyanobium TaxID=2627006 RepID=UPI0020CF4D64|nr:MULTISPECIES: alpha/beta fold hydrolase [unclassified Cyanobium]MCP9777256.1 alpha/beta fold hydrolase [Cyanobium sp. Tous-M-B4]MCP9877439.1 alpha/beta fold hydrolase [Cyanobium sp. A2C-AMD]